MSVPPSFTSDRFSQPHQESTGTLVVGGGAIGLSIAWELVRRGEKVTVIDRGPIAHGTSWAAAGIFPPANFDHATDPIDRLRGFSHTLWPLWCKQLVDQTGIDPGLIRCGGYYLAETVGEASALTGMMSYWDDLAVECQRIELTELLRQQPRLTKWSQTNPWIQKHPESAAWWTPDEYQIRPSRLLTALATACQSLGVELLPHTTILDVSSDNSGCTAKTLTRDAVEHCLRSDRTILCGGAAIGSICPEIRLESSVIPIRGQILLLHSDTFTAPIVLNVGNRYLVARGDGNVLVGSCEEEVGFEQGTTDDVIDGLRSFANRVCPELESATVASQWSGHRPMTFDGFPMIGRVPDQRNVFVAGGHYRSGIHLASGTAVAMADTIEGKRSFMELSDFSVGKQQTVSR